MLKLVIVVCVALWARVDAYSGGAPDSACTTMMPSHSTHAAQSSQSGVSITLSSTTYNCDSTISVTLARATAFKGFICQTRTNVDSFSPTGMIQVMDYQNNCQAGSAVTHTGADDKMNVVFQWKPSGTPMNFTVVCSFVQSFDTFWVRESSSMIQYTGTDATCQTANDDNGGSYVTQSAIFVIVCCALAKLFF